MTNKKQDGIKKPLHIEIALYFTRPQNFEAAPWIGEDIDAVAKIFREFTESGLLEISDEGSLYKATDAMYRYVEDLYRVPFPVNNIGKTPDIIPQLDSLLEKGKKRIGENTLKLKALNTNITTAIADYLMTSPKQKL